MRYAGELDKSGQPIDVRDPLADKMYQIASTAETLGQTVTSPLAAEEVFPF